MAENPLDALPKNLWEASSHAARVAVSQYRNTDLHEQLRAAVSAGLATEQLLMSCVARLDVCLLASRNSAGSMIALSKANKLGRLKVADLRTVNWGEAIKLLVASVPTLSILHDIEFVMVTRNAAAHVAIVDSSNLSEAVVKLVRVVGVLHATFNEFEEDDFWGEAHIQVVAGLRDAHTDEVQLAYDTKVLAARERFGEMLPNLTPAERESVLAVMESRIPRISMQGVDGFEWDRIECPACQRNAYLHYSLARLDDFSEELDFDKEGRVESVTVLVSVEWTPMALECPVCYLELSSEELEIVDGIQPFISDDKHALADDELWDYWGGDGF